MIEVKSIADYFSDLQAELCKRFENIGGSQFENDIWQKAHGNGNSRICENGAVFEKAGVNFSYVRGDQLPQSASAVHNQYADAKFEATGISLVVHPKNPYVPTAHCNFRLFQLYPQDKEPQWWFGGGYDLTPYYPFLEDVITWHQSAFDACRPFGDTVYLEFKNWCDEYFYLKHRDEMRGVGGLFFDNLNRWGEVKTFEFIRTLAHSFMDTYPSIVERRLGHEYGEHERDFQAYRRGRYAEFNLLYDRGTLFGLQFGGRIESILMSLPPKVQWKYKWQPAPDSPEQVLYQDYLKPKDWLGVIDKK